MNHTHQTIKDQLPFYLNGTLEPFERQTIEDHLDECKECQQELLLLREVAQEIRQEAALTTAPPDLDVRVLAQLGTARRKWNRINPLTLIRTQIPLLRSEIWLASFLVLLLGATAAVLFEHITFLYAVAPLVAASCVGSIYGRENDPALELTRTTPTSPSEILLARLVLVFGYNLLLMGTLTLGLMPFFASELGGLLILDWLAPMCFLSMLALLVSRFTSSANAITFSYLLWFAKFFVQIPQLNTLIQDFGQNIVAFWSNPALLLSLSVAFGLATILSLRRSDYTTGQVNLR